MRVALAGVVTGFLAVPAPALACTLCHAPTALGVRDLLFHHDPVSNALALAAPLALMLAAILLMNRPLR